MTLLIGADTYGLYGGYDRGSDSFSLTPLMAQTVLPTMVRTGRCFLPFSQEEIEKPPLQWDEGEPWRFVLEVRGNQQNGWQLSGDFRRGDGRMAVNEPLLAAPGMLVMRDCVARLADDEAIAWITALRKNGSIVVPEQEREEFLGSPAELAQTTRDRSARGVEIRRGHSSSTTLPQNLQSRYEVRKDEPEHEGGVVLRV